MKKKLLGLLALTVVTLSACSTSPAPDPFSHPATPEPGDSWVTPTHPAPTVPTGPQISASALVMAMLDTSTAPTSALVTIKPGVALAVVRLRLSSGIYSPALGGADGVLLYAESPTVRAQLPPGGVIEVAANRGGEFTPLIVVTTDSPEQSWYEATAFTVTRPDTGSPCTATATEQPDHRVAVESINCSGESMAVVTVTERSGRVSHQLIGPQNLAITRRVQGWPSQSRRLGC